MVVACGGVAIRSVGVRGGRWAKVRVNDIKNRQVDRRAGGGERERKMRGRGNRQVRKRSGKIQR